MNDRFWEGFIPGMAWGIIVTVGIAVVLTATGFYEQAKDVRAEAVEVGHAEYYLDENNKRQWRWRGGDDE